MSIQIPSEKLGAKLKDSSSMTQPLAKIRFCVVDTETTGFDHLSDAVVELAGVYMTLEDGTLRPECRLVNPRRPIPPDATEVHGLRDVDVVDAEPLDQALAHLQAHAFDAWAAHNAAFDFGFIDVAGIPVLCTLRLARRLWPNLPAHGNQFLREHFKLEVPGADGLPAHRAEPDALVTAELLRLELRTLMEQHPFIQTLGDLIVWMSEPYILPVCHLGKAQRGKPWSEVPQAFVTWALEHCAGLDLDQAATLRHHLAQKSL
jgi:DNA polymerase III epsilon subunit-like protein